MAAIGGLAVIVGLWWWLVARKHARGMEYLRQATMALMADLDLEQVLHSILVRLKQVVPYDSATVFLIEEEHLKAVAAQGLKDPGEVVGQLFPANDGLLETVHQTGRSLILARANRDPRFNGWGGTDYVRGWMGVPLVRHGQTIGFLTLDSRRAAAFLPFHASLAMAFAGQAAVAIENARLYTAERQRARELDALNTATASLLSTLDLEKLLKRILEAAISAVPAAEKGSLLLIEQATGRLQIRALQGYSDSLPVDLTFSAGEGYAAQSVRQRKPLLIDDVLAEVGKQPAHNRLEVRSQVRSAIFAPLLLEGRAIGVISLASTRPGAFDAAGLQLLSNFAATATIALHNAQLHTALQRVAITDPLTGLYNLRGLGELGRREVDRARRFHRPLSAIFLDVDNFKRFNDTYGHAMGNQVLILLAEHCRRNMRDVDILARYGGEEFVILLPETELKTARQVAERLRLCVETEPMDTELGPLSVTISLGVAALNLRTPDLSTLIKRADAAMYSAKRTGRNLVAVAEP